MISLNALDASHPRPTDCILLYFMNRGRAVLIQDVAQVNNICRTHILFYDEVFKTELFLNYKETLGTFWSKSVNPVSNSLNSVLPELSIQLTNLHSDVNGQQNTIMYVLCSNFRQINDNVFNVKNDVACTETVSDMQFFSSIAQGLIEVLIHTEH